LLPVLPIEVLRLRVARAKVLGLEYRTYASVRASTGHDVVAFLFSTNALRVARHSPAMPEDRREVLERLVRVDRLGLATGGLAPDVVMAANARVLEAAHPAPPFMASWSRARADLRQALGRIPGDRVILVGDMTLEADWVAPGRLAAYVPAERYFG
jgi:hypothetical protein